MCCPKAGLQQLGWCSLFQSDAAMVDASTTNTGQKALHRLCRGHGGMYMLLCEADCGVLHLLLAEFK